MPGNHASTASDPGVCAIVISYQPEVARLSSLCERLQSQCQFIVVDNGSEPSVVERLRETLGTGGHLLAMEANVGIAAAQNAGVAFAIENLEHTPQFLLFLDQDSLIDADFVPAIREEYLSIKKSNPRVGAVGPALVDSRSKQIEPLHHESFGIYWKRRLESAKLGSAYKVSSLNSSGTFVECSVFTDVGGFREDLFIDHVDTEWSMRARHLGYILYVCTRTLLSHEMGRGLEQFWLFGDRRFPSRAPLRHYYLFRNNIFLLSLPQMSKTWKFWSIVKLAFTFCYFGIFSADRKDQRIMMRKGMRDGRDGKLGKYEEAAG